MKKIGITFIVLLVLLGIYAIAKRSLYTETPKETGGIAKALERVAFDGIAEIRLRKGGGPEVVLKKKEGQWVVDSAWGYLARTETVKRLIDALRGLRPTEVAGRKAESHPDFEVGDEKGAFVTLVDASGNVALKIVAGKGPMDSWQDGYVRLADETTVYRAKPNLRNDGNLYSVENTSWVEKKVQELETGEDVTKVEVAGESGTWTLVKEEIEVPVEKKEDTAAKGGGEPAEETPAEPKPEEKPAEPKVEEKKEPETRKETHWYIITDKERFEPETSPRESFVSALKYLNGVDPVEPKDLKEYGLEPPKLRVKTWTTKTDEKTQQKTDKTYEVLFGDKVKDADGKEKSDRYVKLANRPEIFTVGDYKFKDLDKKPEDFKPKPKEEPKKEEGAKAEGETKAEGEEKAETPGPAAPIEKVESLPAIPAEKKEAEPNPVPVPEAKAEQPKAAEPKAEEPKAAEPKIEEPKAEAAPK